MSLTYPQVSSPTPPPASTKASHSSGNAKRSVKLKAKNSRGKGKPNRLRLLDNLNKCSSSGKSYSNSCVRRHGCEEIESSCCKSPTAPPENSEDKPCIETKDKEVERSTSSDSSSISCDNLRLCAYARQIEKLSGRNNQSGCTSKTTVTVNKIPCTESKNPGEKDATAPELDPQKNFRTAEPIVKDKFTKLCPQDKNRDLDLAIRDIRGREVKEHPVFPVTNKALQRQTSNNFSTVNHRTCESAARVPSNVSVFFTLLLLLHMRKQGVIQPPTSISRGGVT